MADSKEPGLCGGRGIDVVCELRSCKRLAINVNACSPDAGSPLDKSGHLICSGSVDAVDEDDSDDDIHSRRRRF